jgi:hypothetical protein
MNTVQTVESCVVYAECPGCHESVKARRRPYTNDCLILKHPEKNNSKKVVNLKPKFCVGSGETVSVGFMY